MEGEPLRRGWLHMISSWQSSRNLLQVVMKSQQVSGKFQTMSHFCDSLWQAEALTAATCIHLLSERLLPWAELRASHKTPSEKYKHNKVSTHSRWECLKAPGQQSSPFGSTTLIKEEHMGGRGTSTSTRSILHAGIGMRRAAAAVWAEPAPWLGTRVGATTPSQRHWHTGSLATGSPDDLADL